MDKKIREKYLRSGIKYIVVGFDEILGFKRLPFKAGYSKKARWKTYNNIGQFKDGGKHIIDIDKDELEDDFFMEIAKDKIFDLKNNRFIIRKAFKTQDVASHDLIPSEEEVNAMISLRRSGCKIVEIDENGDFRGYLNEDDKKNGKYKLKINNKNTFSNMMMCDDGIAYYAIKITESVQESDLEISSVEERYNIRQMELLAGISEQGVLFDFIDEDEYLYNSFGIKVPMRTCNKISVENKDSDASSVRFSIGEQSVVLPEAKLYPKNYELGENLYGKKAICQNIITKYLPLTKAVVLRLFYLSNFNDKRTENPFYLKFLLDSHIGGDSQCVYGKDLFDILSTDPKSLEGRTVQYETSFGYRIGKIVSSRSADGCIYVNVSPKKYNEYNKLLYGFDEKKETSKIIIINHKKTNDDEEIKKILLLPEKTFDSIYKWSIDTEERSFIDFLEGRLVVKMK